MGVFGEPVPTDYKKMHEACPLVAEADAIFERQVAAVEYSAEHERLRKLFKENYGRQVDAALQAQPELKKRYWSKVWDASTDWLADRPTNPVTTKEAFKIVDEAVKNLITFCKAPGS
jgi:hypothetical protein